MPKAARRGGNDTVSIPHPTCQGSTATAGGSSDVFVNSIGVVRSGDAVAPHTFNPPVCPLHSPGLAGGSTNVWVNHKNFGRLGDPYACGATIASGSPDVYVNGD